MITNWHLIVHNVGSIISAVAILGLAIFIVLNNPRSRQAIIFSLTLLSIFIFVVSHVIGVNIADPLLSREILMFNLSIFFIGSLILHSMMAAIDKEKEQRAVIIATYTIGVMLTIFFIIFPDLFLMPSVPKMYFPNYYNPGILNWTRIAFVYAFCVPYVTYQLAKAYRLTTDSVLHQQLKYSIASILIGFCLGFIPNFLVYNINVDPVIGISLFSLFTIPVIYEAVRYGFLNVKVIARQAFFYSLGVIIVGGFITLLNNSNLWLAESFPGFPVWIIPLISSVLAVTVAVVIWRKLREGDLLKYEFITTVTHKFRTPLTHIKWASENLASSQPRDDQKQQLGYIQSANTNLVELTSLLMNVSETEGRDYDYHLERGDLSVTVEEVLVSLRDQLKQKNIILTKDLAQGCLAMYDVSRIRFIIQTFIENAIHYTPDNASINVSVANQGKIIRCSVTDNGIGIPKDEIPRLFSKFYRGHQARLADTEGMGIGLFIAKEIIARHRGKIWVESAGAGKGSTFSFSLSTASSDRGRNK